MEVLVESSTKTVTFTSCRHTGNIFGQVKWLIDTHILQEPPSWLQADPSFFVKRSCILDWWLLTVSLLV